MTDARWIEIEDDFVAAADHFSKAVELFERGGFEYAGLDGYQARMAFMHAMQSAYTSLESGLVRILRVLGEEKPVGEFWHADLIRRVARSTGDRPAILSPAVAELADEARRFRNLATCNYNNFRPGEADKAVAAAGKLAACLVGALVAFRDTIDPPHSGAV